MKTLGFSIYRMIVSTTALFWKSNSKHVENTFVIMIEYEISKVVIRFLKIHIRRKTHRTVGGGVEENKSNGKTWSILYQLVFARLYSRKKSQISVTWDDKFISCAQSRLHQQTVKHGVFVAEGRGQSAFGPMVACKHLLRVSSGTSILISLPIEVTWPSPC